MIALMPLLDAAGTLATKYLAGRPLHDWMLQAARASGAFDEVWVLTASEEVGSLARRSGAQVFEVHDAAPDAEAAFLAFGEARHWDFEAVAVLNAAFPLIRPEHLQEAVALFQAQRADSLVAAVLASGPAWRAAGVRLQEDAEALLLETGAFCFVKSVLLQETGASAGGRVSLYQLPAAAAASTHEGPDWELLAAAARRLGYTPAQDAAIKLLVLDSDGVLNDGFFYYSEEGEALKRFYTRDAAWLKRLENFGVEIGIITGEATGFTPARARKLGFTRLELGCKDKLPVLERWRQELGLEWKQIAYMGDDLPDIPCLQAVGLGGCPADAEPEVMAACRFVSAHPGGRGAVREMARLILAAKQAAAS